MGKHESDKESEHTGNKGKHRDTSDDPTIRLKRPANVKRLIDKHDKRRWR